MMRADHWGYSALGLRLLVAAPAICAVPSPVAAETRAAVDASVGVTAASNPHLRNDTDTGGLGANLTLRPTVTWTSDDTTVNLDGALTFETFFDDYGTDEAVQARAFMEHLANERTTISVDAGFRSSESAARRFFGGADLGNLAPGEFPQSPVIDPTLGSVVGRTSRFDASTTVQHRLSESGVLNVSAGAGMTDVESGSGQDYRDSDLGVSYSHRINERTSLSFTGTAGYADYLNRTAGDGLFTTALVGMAHQLTQSMYGSFQVGISYADVQTLLSGRENVTSWAANLDICDALASGTLCVTGSRGVEPTSLGGITTVSAIGVSYYRAVGTDSNLSLSAGYSKSGMSGSSPILLGRRRSEVAHIGGTYSHRIGERLSAFVTPSFTANNDQFSGNYENYQVLVGISYYFGTLR